MMSIKRMTNDGDAVCVSFDSKGEPRTDVFLVVTLEDAGDDGPIEPIIG